MKNFTLIFEICVLVGLTIFGNCHLAFAKPTQEKKYSFQPFSVNSKLMELNLTEVEIKNTKELEGKTTVQLYFVWASWCDFCHELIPELVALQEKLKLCSLRIHSVNTDSEIKKAEEDLKTVKHPKYHRQIWDPKNLLGQLSGRNILPVLFYADETHLVSEAASGMTQSRELFKKLMDQFRSCSVLKK